MAKERVSSTRPLPGSYPSDGRKFQSKITCSEGHTTYNLELPAYSALRRISAGRYIKT
jgi:hypothetical protein